MKKTQWMLYTKRADFNELAARFSISPVLARIMINRGVPPEKIGTYLHGTLDDLPDPGLMKDLDRAAEILIRKRDEGKSVRVIGDYDIDGICATYILTVGFRSVGIRADYDIPDRIRDGYGLNVNLIRKADEDGIDTIVTCDNGIAAIDEIQAAKDLGMTVIVTDHHEVGHDGNGAEKLPPADAVADPKQEACSYPFDGICGAVVAWKLVGVLYRKCGIPEEKWREFLPFAAIATVGDVMPLREENRIIVREGLKAVAATDNPGLCSLMELCGLVPSEITAYQIGYVIGPCLNAGGRLESAKIGLRMLLETDPEKAEQAAVHLKELNDERKDMTARGVEGARLQAEGELADQKVLVVYLPDCHESVAGIIAGRLREEYYRPSIVLTDSAAEDCIKGSGRSIEGYHMFHALEGVSDLLVRFGGHPMAAGLTLKRENEALLRQRLNDAADLTENDLTEKIWIDAAMPFSYITEDLVRSLSLLEPCGQGNERPLFAQKNVKIRSVRVVGRNRNVVRLSLTGEDGFTIDGVAFTDGDRFLEELKERRVFDILYYPAINEYMGRNTLQIVIRGWKFRT